MTLEEIQDLAGGRADEITLGSVPLQRTASTSDTDIVALYKLIEGLAAAVIDLQKQGKTR